MKYYENFIKAGCFDFEYVKNLVGSKETAVSILKKYIEKGYVSKIRRGLYTAINPIDNEPVANKFVIASNISETAVVSHHSAFEYYGYANQVSYNISVTSESRFEPFIFNDFRYTRFKPNIAAGIVRIPGGIRITDIERTVLDSINDFENDMGFEELIQCISNIPFLKEEKLIRYLEEYGKCFMYQKAGFIFEHFKEEFLFSDDFIKLCKQKSGSSSRYLIKNISKNKMDFSGYWHLTVPHNVWNNLNGGEDYADV